MAEPTWDDGWQNDGAAFMEMAETVTYLPRTGTPRSISAIVIRRPNEVNASAPNLPQASIMVRVRNDTTYGIATSEYDSKGDKVLLALRRGGTAQEWRITGEPQLQNAGTVLYQLR